MPKSYVVYSANEAATNDGAGFWSNDAGWVDCVTEATQFSEADTQDLSLPISTGSDAAFKDAQEFEHNTIS